MRSIEARTGLDRILYLHTLRTVNVLHGGYDIIKSHLSESSWFTRDNRFAQLLGITEVVLCTNLWTILTIDKDNCLIGNIE